MLDSHVHFWDPHARRHAWLADKPSLARRFGPEDCDAGRHEARGMLFVQADCRDEEALAEARWVSELAARDRRVVGIVAYVPLHLGVGARDALAAVAAVPGVVGVRRLLQEKPPCYEREPKRFARRQDAVDWRRLGPSRQPDPFGAPDR